MSLSSLITFALLVKKISRKSAIPKTFRAKTDVLQDCASASSCSSDEKVDVTLDAKYSTTTDTCIMQQSPVVGHHPSNQKEEIKETPVGELEELAQETAGPLEEAEASIIIRDFAFPESSPLHYGQPLSKRPLSELSLSSPDFTGRQARAIYDFAPETEYEIGMKTGQLVWVQYRQCPGWLIADVEDETGLIPESYVEFI